MLAGDQLHDLQGDLACLRTEVREEVEWFPIDGDLDERSVGDRHHRLSDLGEPVCLLGMGDRPRLVEAVEVGADDVMGGALVE